MAGDRGVGVVNIAIIDPIAQKEKDFYFGAQVVAKGIGATKDYLPSSFIKKDTFNPKNPK